MMMMMMAAAVILVKVIIIILMVIDEQQNWHCYPTFPSFYRPCDNFSKLGIYASVHYVKEILNTVRCMEQKQTPVYVFQQQRPNHILVLTEGDKL